MSDMKPIMRASEIRKAMLELTAAGNTVRLLPDGTLISEPVATKADLTPDLIDWRRPK